MPACGVTAIEVLVVVVILGVLLSLLIPAVQMARGRPATAVPE